MARIQFQQRWSEGFCLNVGCGDNPASVGNVQVDINLYNYDNFIQADAHHLPFKSAVFDCVVYGDILEHVVYPEQALKEAARVTRKRLIISVPYDYRFPVGQHIEESIALYKSEDHSSWMQWQDTHGHPLIKEISEDIIPHQTHINTFNEEALIRLIKSTEMKIINWDYVPEDATGLFEWLIVLEKINNIA